MNENMLSAAIWTIYEQLVWGNMKHCCEGEVVMKVVELTIIFWCYSDTKILSVSGLFLNVIIL